MAVCWMRGSGVQLAKCKTVDLQVPADSEFVLEGTITPGEVMSDGPFVTIWAIAGGRFAGDSVV